MMYFLVKINIKEKSDKAALERDDCFENLMDLNTALDSVAPLYSFSQYLDTHKPDLKHLLKLVTKHKIYQDQVKDFNEKEEKVQSLTEYHVMNDKLGQSQN